MFDDFIKQYYKELIGIMIATLLTMFGIKKVNNDKPQKQLAEIKNDNSIHIGDIKGRDIVIGR
jgi:hypothetical protein